MKQIYSWYSFILTNRKKNSDDYNIPANVSIRGLYLIFTHNLSSVKHIESICCKTLKLLWFISRITREFRLSSSLKFLYCTLICPLVEYCSVLWNTWFDYASTTAERVQREFPRFVTFFLNITYPPYRGVPKGIIRMLNRVNYKREDHF